MLGQAKAYGNLGITVNHSIEPADLSWRIRNILRPTYLSGSLAVLAAKAFTKLTGLPVIISELRAIKIDKYGKKIDYGVLSRRVVTDVGADKIALAFTNTFEVELFNYHGVGTGSGAEDATDTALTTESTTALNPDSTRATGVQTNPASKQYRSVGTVLFDAGAAIIEHGLFSQAATGGGSLFDRSIFSAINVVSGDSISFTYTLSITSGG